MTTGSGDRLPEKSETEGAVKILCLHCFWINVPVFLEQAGIVTDDILLVGIMNWAIFGEEQDCYLCVRHLCSLHNHIVDLVKDPAEALVLRDQHLLVRLQLPDRDR